MSHKQEVIDILKNNGRILGSFEDFLIRKDDLRHSYEKFRFAGGVNKPSFDEVYAAVKNYIAAII